MINISQYRARIGQFYSKVKTGKFLYRKFSYKKKNHSGKNVLRIMKSVMKFSILAVILINVGGLTPQSEPELLVTGPVQAQVQREPKHQGGELQFRAVGKKQSRNFWAKYTYGNGGSKGIKNIHLNIRSLGNKMVEVKKLIKDLNPHIFGVSECELKKVNGVFDEKKLKVPGYNLLFPKSWVKSGKARVVVYTKKNLEVEQLDDLQDETVQSIWVKAGFKSSKKIFYCHGYREHTSTLGSSIRAQTEYLKKFLIQWENATLHGNPSEPNETHISCDMNLDALNDRWLSPNYHLHSLSNLVQLTCNTNNFAQLVHQPTRMQFNSVKNSTDVSCIDHIYTNRKFRCSNPVVIPFGDRDHDVISYIRFCKDPPIPARTMKKRSYKNFKNEEFIDELVKVDWRDVFGCTDVDEATEIFSTRFRNVLNNHAPWISFQVRKHYCPWLTEETKNLIEKRDKLKQEAVNLAQAGDEQGAVEAWASFRQVRNKVNTRKKYEEINFKREKISESLESASNTWRCAKGLMNWKSSGGPPLQLSENGRLVTNAKKIATIMNEYFVAKVSLIRDGIGHIPNSFSKCIEIMRGKSCKLDLNHVTVAEVNKILKSLKNSRSTSVDEMDSYCVKIAADIIDKPLHHIITLSILQQKFPTGWKYSKVIPLHKKNCQLDKKNYRPVAILSPFSKVLEKIIFKQLYNYFSRNSLFHPNLHGYRQHRSTQTALLQMYDRWARAAGASRVSGVVLLDLSAAFDLVDPAILQEKLRIYGVQGDFLALIASYLTKRYQGVWMDHILSEFLMTEVGVPQGSILGPLLFLVYFNDLPHTLEGDIDTYADDTTMTVVGDNVEEIGSKLTEDCNRVSKWMKENRLKLNPGKTHILTIGTEQKLRTLPAPVQVVMDGHLLKEDPSKSEFLLGCYIEAGLKWTNHIHFLLKKLQMRLVGLSHLKYVAPYAVRKTIAVGIFNSVLTYCLPLFGGCGKGNLQDLQILQNKAAQIVSHSLPRAPRIKMYKNLDWLTVNQLVQYHSLIAVFKIRKTKEPEYLSRLLCRDSRYGKIMFEKVELKVATRSFIFRSSENWNGLPSDVKNCQTIGVFKKKLRKWIQENVQMFLD